MLHRLQSAIAIRIEGSIRELCQNGLKEVEVRVQERALSLPGKRPPAYYIYVPVHDLSTALAGLSIFRLRMQKTEQDPNRFHRVLSPSIC